MIIPPLNNHFSQLQSWLKRTWNVITFKSQSKRDKIPEIFETLGEMNNNYNPDCSFNFSLESLISYYQKNEMNQYLNEVQTDAVKLIKNNKINMVILTLLTELNPAE